MKISRLVALVVLPIFLLSSGSYAHDVYRFVGTVSKIVIAKDPKKEKSILELKTDDGPVKLEFKDDTEVKEGADGRTRAKAGRAAVKIGMRVVVDAVGVSEDDIETRYVTIVPAGTK